MGAVMPERRVAGSKPRTPTYGPGALSRQRELLDEPDERELLDEPDERELLDEPDERALALAELYMCYCLDFINDIAQAVAIQAVRNPLRYRTSNNYALFHSAKADAGTVTEWLTPAQRTDLYGSIFGNHPLGGAAGGRSMPFDTAATGVRSAAGDVAAAVYGPSTEALFQVLELEAQNFKTAVLEPWPVPILRVTAEVARSNIDRAAEILCDNGVATAFGIEPITAADWPMEVDAAGSLLVAAASKDLGAAGNPPMDSALFTNLQGIAQAGRQTLTIIGAYPNRNPDEEIDQDTPLRALLASALAWQRSIARMQRSLSGGIRNV
jgi:hypothetical protein